MWKNIVKLGRPQVATWRMRVACWLPKTTITLTNNTIFFIFRYNSGYINVRQCYVMCTLPFFIALRSHKHTKVEECFSGMRCLAVW